MSTGAAARLDSLATGDLERLQEFFDYLQENGFAAGIGERVRAGRVFAAAPAKYRGQRLKTLLCPIFARNEEDQQRFYQAFDLFFRPEQLEEQPAALPGAAPVAPPPQAASRFPVRRWRRLAAAALIVCGILTALAYFDVLGGVARTVQPPPPLPTADVPAPAPPQERLEKRTEQQQEKGERPCRGMECVTAGLRLWIILSPIGVYLAALLLARLAWWRRRLVLRRERQRTPPFTWPVVAVHPSIPAWQETLAQAATALRRRLAADIFQLDVPATIKATVQAAGFPREQLRAEQRTPEYLVLINERSERDHYAAWIGQVIDSLARLGVSILQYHYAGDLTRCTTPDGKTSITLRRLLDLRAGHTVLIFGAGPELLHPTTGQLVSWAEEPGIRERLFFFTPAATFTWGTREEVLSRELPVLPARVRHLPLVQREVDGPPPSLALLQRGEDEEMPPVPAEYLAEPDEDDDYALSSLTMFLDSRVFQWLCACAVYPTLEWNLTLQLAQVVDPGGSLYAEPSLLQLIRLRWFREGAIPGSWRAQLVQAMDPELLARVRRFLIQLLEANPAPKGSFARDWQQAQIAAQQYFLEPHSPARRAALELALSAMPGSDLAQDSLLEREVASWQPAAEAKSRILLHLSKSAGQGLGLSAARLHWERLRLFGWKLAVPCLVALVAVALTIAHRPVTIVQQTTIARWVRVSGESPSPGTFEGYGVLVGRPMSSDCSGPRCTIQVSDGKKTYEVRLPVSAGGMSTEGSLLFKFDQNLQAPSLTRQLNALPFGFTPVASTPGGLAIDYARSGLLRQQDLEAVSADFNLPLLLAKTLGQRQLPASSDVTIYAYGIASPDGVLEGVRMNQKRARYGPTAWQDGALLVREILNGQERWLALFLADSSQSFTGQQSVQVTFEGNHYFPSNDLSQSRRLNLSDQQYSERTRAANEAALRSLYQANGFNDVQIQSAVTRTGGQTSVHIQINEGKQSRVDRLTLQNIDASVSKQLVEAVGQPFSDVLAKADLGILRDVLDKAGQKDAKVDYEAVRDPSSPEKVHLTYKAQTPSSANICAPDRTISPQSAAAKTFPSTYFVKTNNQTAVRCQDGAGRNTIAATVSNGSVEISGNGNYLAVSNAQDYVDLYQADAMSKYLSKSAPLSLSLPASDLQKGVHPEAIRFSPTSDVLAIGWSSGKTIVYNLPSGEVRFQAPWFNGHLDFSPDGTELVIARGNFPYFRYSVATGERFDRNQGQKAN